MDILENGYTMAASVHRRLDGKGFHAWLQLPGWEGPRPLCQGSAATNFQTPEQAEHALSLKIHQFALDWVEEVEDRVKKARPPKKWQFWRKLA